MRAVWELIRADSRELPELTPREWERLPKILEEHGLRGLVYSRWRDALPSSVQVELARAWRDQWARNLAYREELAGLSADLASRGIRPVVLKGMALLDALYPDLGARSVSDIDLLIGREQWDETRAVLGARGFVEDRTYRKWEGIEFKGSFVKYAGGIEIPIDLHQQLFYREPANTRWRLEPMAEAARLCDEDLLAHLMGHLGYQHAFLSLNWLVDIDLFCRARGDSLKWKAVAARCAVLGHMRSARAVLWCCRQFLGTPLGDTKVRAFGRDWDPWRLVLGENYLWSPLKRRFLFYLVNNMMNDSWTEALRYDWLWLVNKISS
jgi:hypothetical protein